MSNLDPVVQFHEDVKRGDLAAVGAALERWIEVDARHPDTNLTPLMQAVASAGATAAMVELLLDRKADVRAVAVDKPDRDPFAALEKIKAITDKDSEFADKLQSFYKNHPELDVNVLSQAQDILNSELSRDIPRRRDTVLSLAVSAGDVVKVRLILDAGADIKEQSVRGYDALVHAMHGRRIFEDPQLIPLIQLLIERGAPLNTVSDYGESAVRVASNDGRFDAVKLLLDAGADPAPLEWTPLMHAVATGTLADVKRELEHSPDLRAKDSWERTAFLLSLASRDLDKARLLLEAGSERDARGRCGKTPLMYPVELGDASMLAWLLEQGFDPNAADQFGSTALVTAVEYGRSECARLLADAGADLGIMQYDQSLIEKATDVKMARFLVDRGADLSDVSDEVRAALRKQDWRGPINATLEEFRAARDRIFGTGNPQLMNFPFWQAMVRSGAGAYAAREAFDAKGDPCGPAVWCFRRFGQSINELPDGRIIEIAGEHEDHYDPDFCIYNDVVVHHGDGTFDIYGYPEDVFPPTDSHTATLVGDHIYMIGALGYYGTRQPGTTPVYRLDTQRFTIDPVATTGANPGWIYKHKAELQGDSIIVRGGKVVTRGTEEEEHNANEAVYRLNLKTLVWSKGDG